MRTRKRPHEPREPLQARSDTAEGSDLDAARTEADRLLAAADDAIERALSADSQTFLRAIRQQGGQ
jgi:hypothetical protein